MKFLKYIIFALVILNLPSISLFAFGATVGGILSYATIGLLAFYYFLEKKTEPNWWLIIISLLYYLISSLLYTGSASEFILEIIKFFIFLICGYELTKHISTVEFYSFLLIGALSIAAEALFIPSDYGRFAGFYINANVAGFICITGYAVTYGLKSTSLKLLGQFIFTLTGLLTFSRTFIVIWVLLNIISLKISIKNVRIFGIGFLIVGTLFFIDEMVGLNNPRFEQLKSILNNEDVSTQEINEDSRSETWAIYYDRIFDSPLIGNGYKTFSVKDGAGEGVHNTYLRIIGEAGILPFLIFIAYILYLMFWSAFYFKKAPNLIMQIIALSLFLMANHNFFIFYYVSFSAMWIQYQIYNLKNDSNNDEIVLE
jgi:hypothetical protein